MLIIREQFAGCAAEGTEQPALNVHVQELSAEALVADMLREIWHYECEIIPDYVPANPGGKSQPKCVVRYVPSGSFLRYSCGPGMGCFWDCYGDDFLRPELAIVALSKAPTPPAALNFWQRVRGER